MDTGADVAVVSNGTAERLGVAKLLAERRGGPASRRARDLVLAMIVNRVIAPASKLATVRALNPQTATSSLGDRLGLGEVAEREIYEALGRAGDPRGLRSTSSASGTPACNGRRGTRPVARRL